MADKTQDKSAVNDKERNLQLALAKIEKDFGKGAIMRLGETEIPKVEAISTGCLTLDVALGIGGIPKGRIIEIYGPESSGKTTVALHCVAEVQKEGGTAAFVDAEHALDPVYASKLGVNLDDLYISQPDSGEQALEITETLIRSGAIDIIVIDSVAALTPQAELDGDMGDSHVGMQARLMSQALRKITAASSKSKCTIIFINQLREKIGVMYGNPETTTGGKALKFYSSVRIEIRKADTLKDGSDIVGNHVKAKVVKNKVAPPFKVAEFDIMYGTGISNMGCVLDLAVENGFVQKSGSWFSYNDMKIGQGREKVFDYLKANPDICSEVEGKVREEFAKNSSLLDSLSGDDDFEDGMVIAEGGGKPQKKSEDSDEDDFAEFAPEDVE